MMTILGLSHSSRFAQWRYAHRADARWHALHFGLSQLSAEELARLEAWLDSGNPLALDAFNYDPLRNLWCPLAIGLDIPRKVGRLSAGISNDEAKVIIRRAGESRHGGFTLNPMSGVAGVFFRENRLRDLTWMCRFIRVTRAYSLRSIALDGHAAGEYENDRLETSH